MSLTGRRIKGFSARTIRLGANLRWIVLSLSQAITGLVALVAILPAWVNITLALLSLALLAIEMARYRAEQASFDFASRENDSYSDVREALKTSSRFSVLNLTTGSAVIDRAASRAFDARAIPFEIDHRRFSIPAEFRADAKRFTDRRIAGRIDVFNGAVLGFDTNLGRREHLELDRITLRTASYFDHLGTDVAAGYDFYRAGHQLGGIGRSSFVDRRGELRDFADSWLANAIGVSTIAITTDYRIVTVHQTDANESSRNMSAPSGSGSLEPRDAREATTVSDIVRVGALREMFEETGLTTADVAESAVLGFARWLDKGGKPEFFVVARLSIDSHEARRRRPIRSDRPFSRFSDTLQVVQEISAWHSETPAAIVGDVRNASLPLVVSLSLLADAAHRSPSSPARALLRRAFKGWRP